MAAALLLALHVAACVDRPTLDSFDLGVNAGDAAAVDTFTPWVVTSSSKAAANVYPMWAGGAALDPTGNILATGEFDSGKVTFGKTELAPAQSYSGFAAKLSPKGAFRWASMLPGVGKAVITDAAGNIYLTGGFIETAKVGTATLTSRGQSDAYIVKLSPEGKPLWVKSFGGTGDDYAKALALDDDGKLVVLGAYSATVDFDKSTLVAAGARGAFYLVLAPETGKVLHASRLETSGDNACWVDPFAVALDAKGDLLVGGGTVGSCTLGSQTLTPSGGDIFVVKMTPQGKILWVASGGGPRGVGVIPWPWGPDDHLFDLVVDKAGNSYITGATVAEATFGAHNTKYAGNRDILLAKLSPAGDWLCAEAYGGSGLDEGGALAWDRKGQLYAVGHFGKSFDVGSHTFKASGTFNTFVAKLDTKCGVQSVKVAGGAGYLLQIDDSGDAVVVGFLEGTGRFGAKSVTASPVRQLFVHKLGLP